MNSKLAPSHKIDTVFSLLLFLVFALSAALVLLFGSQVYTHVVSSGQENTQLRTTLSYVTEKIRQNDVSDEIRVKTIQGVSVLELRSNYSDISYSTYIYVYHGALRELTQRTSDSFYEESGQSIAQLTDFQIQEVSKGLYQCTVVGENGKEESVYVSSKCA